MAKVFKIPTIFFCISYPKILKSLFMSIGEEWVACAKTRVARTPCNLTVNYNNCHYKRSEGYPKDYDIIYSYLLTSCSSVVRALVCQPRGPCSIPGMSCLESAITSGNPAALYHNSLYYIAFYLRSKSISDPV